MGLLFLLITMLSIAKDAERHAIVRSEIERVVARYVESNAGFAEGDVMVEFRAIPERLDTVSGSYSIRVASEAPKRLRGNLSLPVEIMRGDHVVQKVIVSIKVRVFGTVQMTTRQVDRHMPLLSSDVRSERMELTSLPLDLVTDTLSFLGQRTTRILSEGTVLTERMVEPFPAVVQGATVTLIVRANNVVLSMNAIAKEDGHEGETISVQRADSHMRVRAKIVDRSTVEIILN